MWLHLLKMIWNRKRTNSLIILEVAIAFVVVFAISVLTIRNYTLYQIPLGYSYENMWRVQVIPSRTWDDKDEQSLIQLINAVKQLPEVEKLNLLANPTFRNWSSTRNSEVNGRRLQFVLNRFDDSAPQHFDMTLLEGRWFGEQDSNQNYDPVVVNQEFAERYFPNESVIGKNIASDEKSSRSDDSNGATAPKETREERIVGVFKDFRQFGELSPITPYVFYRTEFKKPDRVLGLELTLDNSIDPAFEERLLEMLKRLAPEFSYSFTSWSNNRESQLRQTLMPFTILGIIASFLILMVAMGLFGVLWQNVTSRTHEIGLRRALGATSMGIHKQIITELIIVTLMGISIAFVGLVQLPMLGIFQELNWVLFWKSLLAALLFMIMLAGACAFYPGKIATSYSPSQALHYD